MSTRSRRKVHLTSSPFLACRSHVWACCLTLWVSACGGDEPGGGKSALEGIYSVASHTENTQSCTEEGGPTMPSAPFLVVKKASVLSISYHGATGCESLEACRALAMKPQPTGSLSLIFDTTKGPDALAGSTRFTGFSDGKGSCKDPYIAERSFVRMGNAFRIEDRTFKGDTYKADPEGFCNTELGAKASQGKPCSALIVLTGNFVEALP